MSLNQILTSLSTARMLPNHVRALIHLKSSGPISMTELALALGVSTATTTQYADRLYKFMRRRKHPHDRRVQLVSLTDAGLHFVTNLLQLTNTP